MNKPEEENDIDSLTQEELSAWLDTLDLFTPREPIQPHLMGYWQWREYEMSNLRKELREPRKLHPNSDGTYE